MTHEFKHLVKEAARYREKGGSVVMASVVALEGSSYRRPGVRMLLLDDGRMVGAVSGGCVEKEILRQAASVFKSKRAKMMTYDGRYRLGCEGIIYILIEPFAPSQAMCNQLEDHFTHRRSFSIVSHFTKDIRESDELGSCVELEKTIFSFLGRVITSPSTAMESFRQVMPPCFKLYIFGAEHDAVTLCKMASNLGWEVTIIASPDESKTIAFFPGATHFMTPLPEEIPTNDIDKESAILLMSHSFSKDLKALIAFQEADPAYFGLLGPQKRRERLLNDFMEFHPDAELAFLEKMHGPAGLNIGAESAEEIAISILSEILSCIRKQTPMALRDKAGRIHA